MSESTKAIRTQVDNLGDVYAIATGTDCSNLPDKTRQEFRDEADTNKILARYGVDGLRQRPIVFGERDTDMELSRAYALLDEATNTWQNMPTEIRDRFKTPVDLLHAANDGTLQDELNKLRPKDPAEKPAQEKKPDA